MKQSTLLRYTIIFLLVKYFTFSAMAQLPSPALVGYWHNWNAWNAPYIELDQVDSRYNVVNIAFGIPINGTDYEIGFTPSGVTQNVFISQVQTLQNQGRKVLLSLGGATAPIKLDNISERDVFISSVNGLINTYGFDGIDIDFEGSSLSVSGGTIANPVDDHIINLIDAIESIMEEYQMSNGEKLLLTFAPETAFVQGGQSAYNGIWGAYLPVIHALRDSLDLLHVQLYNSGSMYGIDGNIYTQGTADFIVAMTEATIQGFDVDRWTNQAGPFLGLPEQKIAVGLPACPSAAGGGFTDTATVADAVEYILGTGPKPGSYTLINTSGYPNLGGMMTWSVNWDNVNTCNSSSWEYATNFERIFENILPVELLSFTAKLTENQCVQIEWNNAYEMNNDHFIVERSSDGIFWELIDRIESSQSSHSTTYKLLDREPLPNLSYYRLKQFGEDGTHTYSNIVSVVVEEIFVNIYPNPSYNDQLFIHYETSKNITVTCRVTNTLGQVFYAEDKILEKGEQALSVSTITWPTGIYLIELVANGWHHGEILSRN